MADGPIRVGLYVQFEEGSVVTQCVELETDQATGLDVLRQSGLELSFKVEGMLGTAICKIGETGCNYPGEDCFCQCLGTPCRYWTYWYAEGGQWKYSPVGASSRRVKDGDVEGWVWGNGRQAPPAKALIQDFCPPLTAGTPIPTATEEKRPTPSPIPAATARQSTPTISETGTGAALSPSPTPSFAPRPSDSHPAAAFTGLVVGLSGAGVLLLGVVYLARRRQT